MKASLRNKTYHQLFARAEATGKLTPFNRFMVVVIIAAVLLSMGTEPEIVRSHRRAFIGMEMLFGVVFAVEYVGRVWSVAELDGDGSALAKRLRFIISPMAIIDLVVVLAALSPLFFSDAAILRLVRLLRLAALAKFGRSSRALQELARAIAERRYELFVTMALAGMLLLFGATALYWVEREVQPDAFGSIPRALWWSIITLTTVGYGDVSPVTPLGKFLASLVALGGIGLVAMPTGIMAAAFSEAMHRHREAVAEEAEAASPI